MAVMPGFTIGDGWARGFTLEQTADWTGLSIQDVLKEYVRMNATYDSYLQSTQSPGIDPCSALLT